VTPTAALIETLRQQWSARNGRAPFHSEMSFVGDDLVLGAGTKLIGDAKAPALGGPPSTATCETNLVAKLSAAYCRAIEPAAIRHICRALVRKTEGETTLALIHLALTGLGKLSHPAEDSRRLFMAEGFIEAGIPPRFILLAMDLDTVTIDDLARRYNPDELRIPAGNGVPSGRWTDGGAGQATKPAAAKPEPRYAQIPPEEEPRPASESDSEGETFFDPATGRSITFPPGSGLEPIAPPG
jgi:hypothetical protein